MASSLSYAKHSAKPGQPKRFGAEAPRIFTPPLRPLTPETSVGFAVVEFATDVLALDLLPWQRWLLIHALETLDDGTFRFRTVVVLVARQNGKSTLGQVLALFFIYVRAVRLVIGTAQNLDVAEEVWQGAVEIAQETEELAVEIRRVVRVNGKRALELNGGERYKVQAANRRGGRSLSGDLVLLDELREHQTWDSWAAVTKTTLARSEAQVWALSNAGDASSIVLAHLRRQAHAALGDPDGLVDKPVAPGEAAAALPDEIDEVDDTSLGLFEWSAAAGASLEDRDAWAQANPALGYTIGERALVASRRTDPEWVFRTEVLCQWSAGTLEGPFPPGSWEACLDVESSIAAADELVAAVDVSADRTQAHIAFAGLNQHGEPHVEIVATRIGSDWVADWLVERVRRRRPITAVVVQERGTPASALLDDLREALADVPVEVRPWAGSDLAAGTGLFYDLVRTCRLRHLDQPLLDLAAATAVTKPSGDAWLWNRRASPTDIAPLVAATEAIWGLRTNPPATVSAYEDGGLTLA